MRILGLSCYYHDSAAALLVDGMLIAAAEEERFTRKKHDYEFPINAIEFCLKQGGIRSEDLDYVVFYEKPFQKFERILRTAIGTFPKSWLVFREAMQTWLKDKLWVRETIRKKLGVPEEKILFIDHHLSHAASAFFASPFEKAAILTIDGVGEWTTTAIGQGNGSKIRLDHEIKFPHSLGLLYSAFTAFLGFEVNEGEYKVMGMAPYGKPIYTDKVRKVIDIMPDGSFHLDMSYFCFHHSTSKTYNRKFERLFGEPRDRDLHFFTRDSGYPDYFGEKPSNYNQIADLNQHYADLAASIQRVTEDAIVALAKEAHRRTGLDKLCIAGGVGLNSVANGRVLRESGFDGLYIQPAAGDGGGAVGAALACWHQVLGKPRSFVMEHAYWGQSYSAGEIETFLKSQGIKYELVQDDGALMARVVDALTEGKVIGWYQGRFEWGPRALGNRSIIADPGRADMKDIVNTKIKFREPYRPFAPSVLVEKAAEYFDIESPEKHYPARFMLYVVPVREEKKHVLPAITHVDGTGRLQTVVKEFSPRYYRLIELFGQKTGVPVILNTSFNLRGEPIVTTPANAYSTFMKSGMDMLVLENYIVTKA